MISISVAKWSFAEGIITSNEIIKKIKILFPVFILFFWLPFPPVSLLLQLLIFHIRGWTRYPVFDVVEHFLDNFAIAAKPFRRNPLCNLLLNNVTTRLLKRVFWCRYALKYHSRFGGKQEKGKSIQRINIARYLLSHKHRTHRLLVWTGSKNNSRIAVLRDYWESYYFKREVQKGKIEIKSRMKNNVQVYSKLT